MLSIAMTTYNGSKYITEQIESIANQTIQDYELIICDDCSKDNTVEIIKAFQQKDSRIKLFCNEQNLGFKKNFEKAVQLCQGEYIALCDQDDVWTENHLEALYSNIGDNYVIAGNNELVDKDLKSLNQTFFNSHLFSAEKYPTNKDIIKKILFSGNCFQGASMMLHKNILPFYLPLPEKIKYHDSWLAALACTLNKFTVTETVITKYRQHEAQVTSGDKSNSGFSKGRVLFCDELLNHNLPDSSSSEIIKQIKKYFSNTSKVWQRIKQTNIWKNNYSYIYPDKNKAKLIFRYLKYLFLYRE
jgi:glycosyltransferase involved in cell wall biosynthesis